MSKLVFIYFCCLVNLTLLLWTLVTETSCITSCCTVRGTFNGTFLSNLHAGSSLFIILVIIPSDPVSVLVEQPINGIEDTMALINNIATFLLSIINFTHFYIFNFITYINFK